MDKVHLLCNAHIDPIWLWMRDEGIGEALSTFRIAVDFCEKEDAFVFNHNEAVLYQWVEEYEPELFERIQQAVKNKRWFIMGGWYLQPDCNMPNGEGIIRQIKLGQQYFKSRFGEDFSTKTALNLDSFGHNRGLVQILHKAGYLYYLACRPNVTDFAPPSDDFIWDGYDGSSIYVHRDTNGYTSSKGQVFEKLCDVFSKNPEQEVQLVLWGIGNHGGGPSKEDYNTLKNIKAGILPGSFLQASGSIGGVESSQGASEAKIDPKLFEQKKFICSTPDAFFEEAIVKGYFQHHIAESMNPWGVGCYTSQVRIKQLYCRLESALTLAEKMASAMVLHCGGEYPHKALRGAEEDLAFAQFHDILPGSSIKEAEDYALRLLSHGIEECDRIITKAFFRLSTGVQSSERGEEIPILAYNPNPYTLRTVLVTELQKAEQNWGEGFSNPIIYQDEKRIPSQTEKEASNINLDWRKKIVFEAELPPFAMSRFTCRFETLPERLILPVEKIGDCFVVQASHYTAEISCTTGLLALQSPKSTLANAFALTVYDDNDDPWGMLSDRFDQKIATFSLADAAHCQEFLGYKEQPEGTAGVYKTGAIQSSVRLVENGTVRTVFETLFVHKNSTATMQYILYKNQEYFDVEIQVNWNEAAKMLKLAIPFSGEEVQYLGQGMFGHEQKDIEGQEVVAQGWTMVQSAESALLCLNKGSYGSSYQNGVLSLTLLRSPAYSCHPIHGRAHLSRDRFSPRIDMGERNFSFRFYCGQATELLRSAARLSAEYLCPSPVVSFYPSGKGETAVPPFVLSNPDIQLSHMDMETDGVLLRLWNPTAECTKTQFTSRFLDSTESIELGAFEFATYRLLYQEKMLVKCDTMF